MKMHSEIQAHSNGAKYSGNVVTKEMRNYNLYIYGSKMYDYGTPIRGSSGGYSHQKQKDQLLLSNKSSHFCNLYKVIEPSYEK
jgi:hypothetical protein